MPRIKGLKVVRSPISGYGLITTRKFRRGSVVTESEGVIWHARDKRDDRYSLTLDNDLFLDMVDQTRWVNHSCEPNLVVEAGITAGGRGWAQLIAAVDLKVGTELTYDYGFPPELKERCYCGTKSCRGWIVDANSLPKKAKRASTGSR